MLSLRWHSVPKRGTIVVLVLVMSFQSTRSLCLYGRQLFHTGQDDDGRVAKGMDQRWVQGYSRGVAWKKKLQYWESVGCGLGPDAPIRVLAVPSFPYPYVFGPVVCNCATNPVQSCAQCLCVRSIKYTSLVTCTLASLFSTIQYYTVPFENFLLVTGTATLSFRTDLPLQY